MLMDRTQSRILSRITDLEYRLAALESSCQRFEQFIRWRLKENEKERA